MYGKRGQITVFIVLGGLILLSLFLAYYAKNVYVAGLTEPKIYEGAELPQKLDSLNTYIETCIQQEAEPSIERLSRHGGTLDFSNSLDFKADEVNILCEHKEDQGCIPTLLTKDGMQRELNEYIKLRVLGCIDFEEFEKRGYNIVYDPNNILVDTIIARDDIFVKVEYPITLTQDDQELRTSQFQSKIASPLGRLYDLTIDITNKEITQGYFNKDEWMTKNHAEVIIEKARPYPDIIYTLSRDGLVFNFAIKGIDTAGKGYYDNPPVTGCSYEDTYCFAGADCECPSHYIALNESPLLRNCGDHKHGESWCEYDSPAGQGLDYVGSRHYKVSCINGRELVEPCRDYREELCTEENKKAVCRVNRWSDCFKCTTKECCENLALRDCRWKDFLETDRKCVPYVPPGLKFWETTSVCSAADQRKEFKGQVTRNAWVDSTAMLCYFMGDCGNYRNIADKITYEGFRNTDAREQPYVYRDAGLIGKDYTITLPLDSRDQNILSYQEFTPSSSYPTAEQISMALQHADSFSFPNGSRPALSRCEAWTSPVSDKDCNDCEEKECSEYRCRSLGEQCIYTNFKGIPKCYGPVEADRTAPKIFFDEEALSEDYSFDEAKISVWYEGVEITPEITPHKPVTFGITTSEATRCKLTYFPESEFTKLPPYWFGSSDFTTKHNITLRLPKTLAFPEEMYDSLNITSIAELADIPGFVPAISKIATKRVLEDFEAGKYHFFVKCYDQSGNENKDEFFIRFSLANITDTEPPVVENVEPKNNSMVSFTQENITLSIYTDELAECRLSTDDVQYDWMEFEAQCPTSQYQLSSVNAGTYRCTIRVPFEETYYIRCSDNETNSAYESYVYNLRRSEPLEIISYEPGSEVNSQNALMKVTTSGNMETDGITCSYSSGGEYFVMDQKQDSFVKQLRHLEENTEYTYNIRCEDRYGNTDTQIITFSVII